MSPRRGTRSPGKSSSSAALVWVAVIVVVLIVADVLLIAVALSRTAPADNGRPGPVPTYTSSPQPSRSSTPGASSPAGAEGQSVPERRLLSAVSSTEAWRATSGSCTGPEGELEHSTDGGATWERVALGDDVRTVLALRTTAGAIGMTVGVGDDCDPTVRVSSDGGSTWKAGTAGDSAAGIGTAGLLLSTGTIPSPCADPLEAFQGQYTTAVVCADSLQWRSGTKAWVPVPVAGVRSIADDGDQYTIARVGVADCAGVEIASLPAVGVTSGTKPTNVGCAADASDDSAAIARNGQQLWLWSGDDVSVSNDGGISW